MVYAYYNLDTGEIRTLTITGDSLGMKDVIRVSKFGTQLRKDGWSPDRIVFVCADTEDLAIYELHNQVVELKKMEE